MAWRDLYDYWRDSHQDGRPPSRADIDPPLQIPRLLPNLFLIDVMGESFHVRIIGSEITRWAGRDMTGQMLDSAIMPERAIPDFTILLRRVAVTQAPLLYAAAPGPRSGFGATGILLPLINPMGMVEMILGGLFHDATAGLQSHGETWDPGALTELPFPESPA